MYDNSHQQTLAARIDWDKQQGMIPAIVQDHLSGTVLMLGYMDRDALAKTLETGLVTFYSRSKQRLWTKGESSGNGLKLVTIDCDCDNDTLLVQALPQGPTCHLGTTSCWDTRTLDFSAQLAALIQSRRPQTGSENSTSYTSSLFQSGTKRIAQKVGEEGLETALAAATGDKAELVDEAADLLFHLMVLLEDQGLQIGDIQRRLFERHQKRSQG
ncbi:bifunctional phosphoribosyl-AMP cyclohydrolase/phosphoribosyl-ATP diphosphatase HisIE [Shewanella sedimentimangrovi]|uniref:Histidine biosynthesis bifunctional protein HisIE n=1 Tax=Shewanella sedimentimangrovi TaxID=2814293 RepID=A0ABX7R655_9GAMM|nr:bifunctional phosphoribosyl-AMP cyclohydrolase/phosphoribosyl-ATP diphosphatase HisIE [Shewanella sedimentimangrovi]QSX38737.1 bifunctional phosphoribosyl-AMP cyclohydrolase/phosphoribosyl-ATP diphosphatase HisIE [Shewanella sedimentimangrovi]